MLHDRIVGRDAELARLEAARKDAERGYGGLWLLTGEPGIGKTRLAEESELMARAAGFVCVWGRCWESGGAPAFWPWSQIARALARTRVAESLPLPTSLSAFFGEAERTAEEGSSGRFLLFDTMENWLGDLANQEPLWIGLEDLHAADPASLALLEALAAPLRAARILVVGTVRDETVLPASQSTYARLARKAHILPVTRLDRCGAQALLQGTLTAPDDELVAAALEQTEGHPLFLVEWTRLVQSVKDKSPLELIFASVHKVLEQRLNDISDDTLDVLRRAALMGMDLDRAALARMCGAESVDACLTEAQRASIVRRLGPFAFRFSHGLLREVLTLPLGSEQLERLHAEIATAHKAANAPPAVLAHHLNRAGSEQASSAQEASLQAAQVALGQYAFEDALYHLEQARQRLPASAETWMARLEVARALALLGLGRLDEGLAACASAAELAMRAKAFDTLAEAALARGSIYRFVAVDDQLVTLLEQALAHLPSGDSPLRAQVLARLAAARQPDVVPERPIAMAREAIAMAERVGGDLVRIATLRAGCSALVDLVHPRERFELDRRHRQLALEAGANADVLTAGLRLIFDCMELGDMEAAQHYLEEAVKGAHSSRYPADQWRVPALQALRQLWQGPLTETRSLIEEAGRLGKRAEDRNALVSRTFQLARWIELTGHEEQALDVADDLGTCMASSRVGRLLSALSKARFLILLGKTDAGVAALDEASVRVALGLKDRTVLHAIALWAAAARDASIGRAVLERLRDDANSFCSDGVVGMCWRGPIGLVLGPAAEACDDFEAALGYAQEAARMAERCTGPIAAAEAHTLATRYATFVRRPDLAANHTAAAEAIIVKLGLYGLGRRLREEGRARARSGTLSSSTPAMSNEPPFPLEPAIPSFVLEGDVYCITWHARSVRLQVTKGLAVLAHLVAHPRVALHALDLMHLGQSHEPADRGDAGELLDAQALAAYRARAKELDEELAEAKAYQDLGRIGSLQAELEFLAAELGRSQSLGGGSRRAPGTEERARQAIRKQVRTGVERIRHSYPELARYLERAVRTGRTCVFEP